jgi:isopentenyl-diphosphate Delta-isomerase
VVAHVSSRERHPVEVVDHTGRAQGVQTVEKAHQAPGQLHRAFSVLLTDDSGRILLQRRSAAKTRFASLWANACCGHPAPGQSIALSANRRLHEELGLQPIALADAGVYLYYAEDPIVGRVEFEYDHVLIGRVPSDVPLTPDPNEVADLQWVNQRQLKIFLEANPKSYTPWLVGVIARLAEHRSTTDPAKPAEPSGGR